MASARADTPQAHRSAQIIAGLWSIIFIVAIWFGYYLLFSKNTFAAFVLATIIALIAWSLARFIGSHEGGIRLYWPMLALLFVLSAVGVFNSLMLNLEGRQIFLEAISDSEDRFTALDRAAAQRMAAKGINNHLARVSQLESALIREIKNPLNCGQGPVARGLIAELQTELPGFVPLSSTKLNCGKNDQIVADYQSRIDELVEGAPWADPSLSAVRSASADATTKLQQLGTQSASMFAPGLLTTVAPELARLDVVYRTSRDRLSRANVDTIPLPTQLHLSEIDSLGEWSQLPRLIGQRLNHGSTYLYFFLAIAFDLLTVYFFGIVRRTRPGYLRRGPRAQASLQSAW